MTTILDEMSLDFKRLRLHYRAQMTLSSFLNIINAYVIENVNSVEVSLTNSSNRRRYL